MKLATGRRLGQYLIGELGWQINEDYGGQSTITQKEVRAAKVAVFDRMVVRFLGKDAVTATARGERRFSGLYCCKWDCEKEADFLIVGNLNNGMDNDTHSCEEHVVEMLGTPDFLTDDNTEWVVSVIPQAEKERYRDMEKVV